MKRPPDFGISEAMIALAVTSLALSAASTGVSVSSSQQAAEQAKQAGKDRNKASKRVAAIRAGEARETRRRLVARAQAMGASGGSPIPEASLFQIGRDVDRQAAIDIWEIRQRGVDAQTAGNQQATAFRAEAATQGLRGGSQLIRSGMEYRQLGVF